jgi:hypothetical protein
MNDFGIIPASTPIPTTLPKTSGNGFGIIPAPPIDYEKRRKEEERKKLETEARKAQVDAQFASSKVVKVANTIKEFGNETLKDIEGMSNYIVNTYKKNTKFNTKRYRKKYINAGLWYKKSYWWCKRNIKW